MRHIHKTYRRPKTSRFESFSEGITTLTMFTAVGAIFFIALTSTLDDMTQRDCDLGVQAACEALND